MARRLILDTGVLIAAERHDVALAVDPDDDVVIAAVTVAELGLGVELSSAAHRPRRQRFVDRVIETVPIVPSDLEVANVHARLLAFSRRAGTTRGVHDLIIAATAVATDRTLLSIDRRARFADLPGVHCASPDAR